MYVRRAGNLVGGNSVRCRNWSALPGFCFPASSKDARADWRLVGGDRDALEHYAQPGLKTLRGGITSPPGFHGRRVLLSRLASAGRLSYLDEAEHGDDSRAIKGRSGVDWLVERRACRREWRRAWSVTEEVGSDLFDISVFEVESPAT